MDIEQRLLAELARLGLTKVEADRLMEAAMATVGTCPCPGCAWTRICAQIDPELIAHGLARRACIEGGQRAIVSGIDPVAAAQKLS